MTTTDEMEKKLLEENEQLKADIKLLVESQIKPKEKQLQLNRKVLAVINKQKYKIMPKRKYAKKKTEEQTN